MPFPPILNYWLVVPGKDAGYTPFQGFGTELLGGGYPVLIGLMGKLPASVPEIFLEPKHLPDLRRPFATRQTAIVGLPTYLELAPQRARAAELNIVIALPDELAAIAALAEDPPPIFATLTATPGAHALADFDGHPAQLLDQAIHEALIAVAPEALREELRASPLRAPFPKGTEPSRMSGTTAPNEILAASLGFAYDGAHPIDAAQPDAYVDAILESTTLARSLIGGDATGMILYAPAIIRALYAFNGPFWNSQLRKIRSQKLREFIKDGIFRNPGYSGFAIALNSPDELPNPYHDEAAAPLLYGRQSELRLTARGVGALAASTMQPAVRLPNSVNFFGADLREIEQHADRDSPRGRRLLQAAYNRLAGGMLAGIDSRLIEDIRANPGALTVVADAPIEWIRIDGLPLMIQRETSRVGMTPGNQMLAQCTHAGMLTLPQVALDDVLVVRSFQDGDPIKGVLEGALDQFDLERVRVRFVDVEDVQALTDCLNNFDGALVVFDCHGGHGGHEGHGWLHIGNEKVDVWQLAHKARIPPIVVLSACSTYALAGSHASVANGLLRSGAITVIGTYLPVNAVRSAAFVARLLYRIEAFLPAIAALGRNFITWRALVATFIQMSYATDLVKFFINDKGWMHAEMFRRISVASNHDINGQRQDWHKRLLRRIAAASSRPFAEVQAVIDSEAALVETMYYCQTGRPETIGIYLGDGSE